MAEFLVANGADPTIRGWIQISALDRAARRKDDEGATVHKILRVVLFRQLPFSFAAHVHRPGMARNPPREPPGFRVLWHSRQKQRQGPANTLSYSCRTAHRQARCAYAVVRAIRPHVRMSQIALTQAFGYYWHGDDLQNSRTTDRHLLQRPLAPARPRDWSQSRGKD
jgi:hypothetical protein